MCEEVTHASAAFLEHAARYFEKRPTGGEDSAHWSNIYNAENCRKAAAEIGILRRQCEAAARENIALRCLMGGGCDANRDGPHNTIIARGKERFCNDCGETLDAKGQSKPWFHNGRLERAVARLALQDPANAL